MMVLLYGPPMEGMKVSDKLVQVTIEHSFPGEDLMAGFLRLLALEQINMNLFIGKKAEGGVHIVCAAAMEDQKRLKGLTDSSPDLKNCASFHVPVSLISIHPHQSSLSILGFALLALEKARVPVHGFCSSLSTLTFITDHAHLPAASGALKECFRFPTDHSLVAG